VFFYPVARPHRGIIFESRPPRHKKRVPQGACFFIWSRVPTGG